MLSLSSLPNMVGHPSSPPTSLGGVGMAWGQTFASTNLEGKLYQTLQEALTEIDLPETQDLPHGLNHSDLCICVLGSPLPYLSLLVEAGQRSPGDALLCLSPTWLSRSSSSLMVHRAVTFDLGGRTFLSNFNPPRKVTYLLSCDPWGKEEVTCGTDCPMGGSGSLEQFWGDVLCTRVRMNKAKIICPATLAFLMPPGQIGIEEGKMGGVEVVYLEMGMEDYMNSIKDKVDSFLESEALKRSDKVILRCSGGRFVGETAAASPTYMPLCNTEEICSRVAKLLPQLLAGEAVLLESYCPPIRPGCRVEDRRWEQYNDCRPQVPDLSFRLCAIVTRSPQDVPLLYKMACKVGASDIPLSHNCSLSQSLASTLLECGYSDPNLAVSLRRLAANTALSCLRVVMETESSMSAEQRGGSEAQTDIMGVDLIFTLDGSFIKPVVLGLHLSRCLHSCFQDQAMESDGVNSGLEACQGTLLLSPLIRSQCYLMRGKTILVVGAGAYSKKFIWEAAKQNKLKILLVDCDPNHFASKMVDHFLPLPDIPDHRRDDQHCIRICDWLASTGLQPDGCVCFWDDCVVLTSLVCERLGLRGTPTEAIRISKEKSRTHQHLLGLLKSTGIHPVTADLPSGQADGLVELKNGERGGMVNMEGNSLRAMADFDRGDLFDSSLDKPENTSSSYIFSSFYTPSSSFKPSTFNPSTPQLSPSPSCYAVPCIHVESALDLEKAAQGVLAVPGSANLRTVRFPAVLKLEYGSGAVGVRKVDSLAESLMHFERIVGDLREETDYPGIGLGWGNAMILMEYLGGTEHDVDVLLFNGRLEGAFVSDNGPTRAPAFTETAAQMPSGLAPDKRTQLIRAAHHACLGCGLRNGVFNVELKMTELGPRLIEINARMGGFYLRDWILQLYGVDILMAAFMVACGVRPCLPSATELPARGHIAGVMCVVSQHLQALRSTARPERLRSLHKNGELCLNELAADDELISGEYEEPFCNVGVRDTHSGANARQRLLALCQGLGLHCPPRYDLSYFLSQFS